MTYVHLFVQMYISNHNMQEVPVASITKAELLDKVAKAADTTKADAERVLAGFFDVVTSSTKAGEVGWPGFGNFSTTKRPAREGRNPRTGETVKIAASTAMKFTSSSTLKTVLNTKGKAKK